MYTLQKSYIDKISSSSLRSQTNWSRGRNLPPINCCRMERYGFSSYYIIEPFTSAETDKKAKFKKMKKKKIGCTNIILHFTTGPAARSRINRKKNLTIPFSLVLLFYIIMLPSLIQWHRILFSIFFHRSICFLFFSILTRK